MIITNFETEEESAFLTWIELYDILVNEILKLQDVEDFKWKIEEVMMRHNLERDSLDGLRYVFAIIGAEFLGLNFKETDKVFERLMKAVYIKTGGSSVEDLDKCLSLDFLQSVVRWRYIDCKQIYLKK